MVRDGNIDIDKRERSRRSKRGKEKGAERRWASGVQPFLFAGRVDGFQFHGDIRRSQTISDLEKGQLVEYLRRIGYVLQQGDLMET